MVQNVSRQSRTTLMLCHVWALSLFLQIREAQHAAESSVSDISQQQLRTFRESVPQTSGDSKQAIDGLQRCVGCDRTVDSVE